MLTKVRILCEHHRYFGLNAFLLSVLCMFCILIHNLSNDEKSYLKILDWHSSISTLITCLITKKIVKRRYEKIPI